MFYFIIIILLIIALTNLMMGYYLKDKLLVSLSILISLLSLLYSLEYLNMFVLLKYSFKRWYDGFFKKNRF